MSDTKQELTTFAQELEELLNRHNCEGKSNTPDFILAEYLCMCLDAFNDAVNKRMWYRKPDATEKAP